jgi:hypothetical protein
MDFAVAVLPDPSGVGIVASTRPLCGSTFWMRLSEIWNRCRPSKAVPACAGTSIERTLFPLSGSSAFSLSPVAIQTWAPS